VCAAKHITTPSRHTPSFPSFPIGTLTSLPTNLHTKTTPPHTQIAEVGQRMVASYPDTFTGVRVIVSAVRKLPDVNISATLQIATQMVENRPDVVAGFDLVGAAAEQERSCG